MDLEHFGTNCSNWVAGKWARKCFQGLDNSCQVGIDYGADVMVSMQQWLGESIYKLTGTGFGTRFPGVGTMPGEAMPFKQISALGDDWLQQLQGSSAASKNMTRQARVPFSSDTT